MQIQHDYTVALPAGRATKRNVSFVSNAIRDDILPKVGDRIPRDEDWVDA